MESQVIGAGGAITLPATMPAGAPSGLSLFLQAFVIDATAPNGQYAASNGLQLLVP